MNETVTYSIFQHFTDNDCETEKLHQMEVQSFLLLQLLYDACMM